MYLFCSIELMLIFKEQYFHYLHPIVGKASTALVLISTLFLHCKTKEGRGAVDSPIANLPMLLCDFWGKLDCHVMFFIFCYPKIDITQPGFGKL